MSAEEKERIVATRKRVCMELINMLENNIINEYGSEPFMGWCEDGEVFENEEELKEECLAFAKEVAPIIDQLSDRLAVDNYLDYRETD